MSTSHKSPVLGSVLIEARALAQQGGADHGPRHQRSRGEVAGPHEPVHEPDRVNRELASQHQLSAMTIHDLCSPAQVILALSELLLDEPTLDEVLRRRLEQMHRSALTMSAMIADLSAGLTVGSHAGPASEVPGKVPGKVSGKVVCERVNLAELVTSVVERTRVLAAEKSLRILLLVDRMGGEGCWVEGDAVKLERALVNLLANAIKFSPTGSTVSVALDRGAEHAKVAVIDQGPGISAEGRTRVFEAFHREVGTAHLPGQGLGLFITREIVEGHGGTVTVDSRPGCGARFRMQIPLAPRPPRPAHH